VYRTKLGLAAAATALVLVSLVLLDVVGGVFTVPAAAVEHAFVQTVLWPFILLDRFTEVLPHTPAGVLLGGGGIGAAALFLAAQTDRGRPGAGIALEVLIGAPALLIAVALIGAGLGFAPPVLICGLAGVGFGVLSALPGEGERDVKPSGLPSRLVVRAPLLFGAGLALAAMATVLAPGPGDAQVPLDAVAALDGIAPPALLPWLVAALVALGAYLLRPAASEIRAGNPELVAALVAGLATTAIVAWWAPPGDRVRQALAAAPLAASCSAVGSAMVAGGGPSLGIRPTQLLQLLVAPLVAAAMAVTFTAATGFLGCDEVRSHPSVTPLVTTPGTFALQPIPESRGGPTGGAIVVAFRDAEEVLWIPLGGGDPVRHDLNRLEVSGWDGTPAPQRRAYPAELGLDSRGRVHVWVEVPPPVDVRVRLLIDPRTGAITGFDELPDACLASSWLWDEPRGRAAVGCEWDGELMLDDAAGLDRRAVEGAGDLEELIVDPSASDRWLAVSLWSRPWLVRVDPEALSVTDRRFLGSFNWGLAGDPASGQVAVPRFLAGQVLILDAARLTPVRSVRAGWGLRPIVKQPGGPWLSASTYDGWLYAVPSDGEGRPPRLRLGGWVRDIDLLDETTLIAGGVCGVMKVDLNTAAW
jgi:hypothetical protein